MKTLENAEYSHTLASNAHEAFLTTKDLVQHKMSEKEKKANRTFRKYYNNLTAKEKKATREWHKWHMWDYNNDSKSDKGGWHMWHMWEKWDYNNDIKSDKGVT